MWLQWVDENNYQKNPIIDGIAWIQIYTFFLSAM